MWVQQALTLISKSLVIILFSYSVLVRVKIDVDGAIVYESPNFDQDLPTDREIVVGTEVLKYDMEEYYLPPVIRKILKTTKTGEIF